MECDEVRDGHTAQPPTSRPLQWSRTLFHFKSRLQRPAGSWYTFIDIPATVSRATGKRGPVPVIVLVNGTAEVRASIVPCGDGRHQLMIHTRARTEAGVEAGDRIDIALRIDEDQVGYPIPEDLAHELRRHDVFEAYQRLPVGKRNHIVRTIEEAAAETTREKRIDKTVEIALAASEREFDRAAKKAAKKRDRKS
jgi:hypothetical protein